jgi:hypothetical protein
MPNSTSIQTIPQINLSSSTQTFEAGKFENSFIKSMNIDIGLTDNPTSINLGLISLNGTYPDYGAQSSLNYLSPYTLNLGNQLNIICYLISQKKSISSNSKTSQLEFVDGSHILDRVFVGGIGVHVDPNNERFSRAEIGTADIPVACAPCYTNNQINILDPNEKKIVTGSSTHFPSPDPRPDFFTVNPIYTERVLRSATKNVIGDWKNGGYIFLGDEKFTKTSCEIPTVNYSFQDLKDACANMGINILIEDPSYDPATQIHALRKSHWGTLRSVLKSWCADFGITFYYDYSVLAPTIRGIDLTKDVLASKIQIISNTIKTIKSGNNTLIESIDESKTIKGSFKNDVITTYKRGRVKRNFSKQVYYGTAFKCFQATDVLSDEARSYRNLAQWNASCYLAKYNQNIRTLFVARLASQRWSTSGYSDGRIYRALGFDAQFNITGNLKNEIIDECLNTDTYREVTENFLAAGIGITDFDMILGSYSEDQATKHADFEKSFAEDFIGKYFFTNFNSYSDSKYGGWQQCFTGADWRYTIESTLTPEAKPIFTSKNAAIANLTNLQARLYNQQKLPFAKNLWGAIPKNFWSFYDWFSDARLKIFNRSEAPWSTTQEMADKIFTDPKSNIGGGSLPSDTTEKEGQIDLTLPFLPRFQKIAGIIETRLRARFKGTQIAIPQAIDHVKTKTVPCIMIAPRWDYLAKLLEVSEILPENNPAETPWYFSKDSSMGNKPNCDSSMKCEIQEGLDKDICKPSNLCAGYPTIPPQSVGTNEVGKIYQARDNNPFPEGVLNFIGGGLTLIFRPPIRGGNYPQYKDLGPPRWLKIIGPAGSFPNINDIYLANYKESIQSDYYSPKIEKFLGDKNLQPPENVSEVKMTLNNVSSNDPIFSAKRFDPQTGKEEISVLTNVYIPGYGYLTIEEYHNFLLGLSDQGIRGGIKHDLTVKFGSLDVSAISQYFNSKFGLSKLSCSIESNGISATASWTNRPATPPQQDLFTREIEPQIMSRSNFN